MHKPLLLLLILSVTLSGCLSTAASKTVNVTIEAAATTVSAGESISLTAAITENGMALVVDDHQVSWELSNTSVAELSSPTGRQVTLTALTGGSVSVTASFGKTKSKALTITITETLPEENVLFLETFDNVPNGDNIKDESVRSNLDNPDSIVGISGTMRVTNGVLEMDSQRFALEIPGLAEAANPILRITIKNDNGSGGIVTNLKLAVGSEFTTSRPAFTAHGEHLVTNSDFQVLEIELNKDYIQTGILNFRGMAGDKSTAGLFVDEIKVVDIAGYQPPDEPSDPGSSDPGDPDPGGQDPDEPYPNIPTDPPPVIDDAYFGLVGWAAENGGTTGGEGCPENKILFINNGRDLYDALYENERRHKGDKKYGDPYPLIIYITGKITKANTGEDKIDLKDQKNVSIIGVDDLGEFDGIGIKLTRAENIIIRNLTIHHVRAPEDGIEIVESKNVWIDRNTFYNELLIDDKDYYDGLLDIKSGSEYVTVSWNKFYNNAKGLLLGHTDSPDYATKITYHHNHFYNLYSRVPLIRYAQVHMFNNLIEDIKGSAINVRMGAKVRVENNYFDSVGSGKVDSHANQVEGPIGWWYGSPQTGYWEVIDNIFVDCPKDDYESTTTVHIPYDYSLALNDAERAKELVLQYAGAGSPSLQ